MIYISSAVVRIFLTCTKVVRHPERSQTGKLSLWIPEKQTILLVELMFWQCFIDAGWRPGGSLCWWWCYSHWNSPVPATHTTPPPPLSLRPPSPPPLSGSNRLFVLDVRLISSRRKCAGLQLAWISCNKTNHKKETTYKIANHMEMSTNLF